MFKPLRMMSWTELSAFAKRLDSGVCLELSSLGIVPSRKKGSILD